jgi:hypothetical protein
MARMVDHPSYLKFSEPGFRGNYQVIAWHGRSAHVRITSDDEDDEPFEVVWMLREGHWRIIHDEGRLQVYMKEYNRRQCLVEIMQSNARMVWRLDVHPTAIG